MTPMLFCLLLATPAADVKDLETSALEKVNAFRKVVGQPAVKIDADLSKSCTAHAEYLIQNLEAAEKGKLNVHDEDAKLPGFTEAGRKAARSSEVAQGTGGAPLMGFDLWFNSYYHRTGFLNPSLTHIGIGFAAKGRSWAVVLDDRTGAEKPKGSTWVCYPVPKQMDVPLLFSNGWPEFPNPIPENGESRKTGYPITVAFFQPKPPTIKNVTATLKDAEGNDVEHWLSWPEKPAVKGYGNNLIGLIPKAPLKADTTYTVEIKAAVNGEPWKSKWSITTGENN